MGPRSIDSLQSMRDKIGSIGEWELKCYHLKKLGRQASKTAGCGVGLVGISQVVDRAVARPE